MKYNKVSKFNITSTLKLQLLFCLNLTLLYLALFIFKDGLRFPLLWDEHNFWRISQSFSLRLIPTLEQLRNYNSPTTPLSFLVFGYLEFAFHDGIFTGRLLNLILSFMIVCLIGMPKSGRKWHSILAAGGLMIFPYYFFLSFHLYTDIVATFFVVLGFWLYTRNSHILSSICFVLAIACRQYTLPFPVAIAVFELINCMRQEKHFQANVSWLAQMTAAATILGWIWLFGGLVPQVAAGANNLPIRTFNNLPLQIRWIFPEHSLYFLACIGLYFVIPEWILFRRWRDFHRLVTLKNCSIAFVVLALFFVFPPIESKGILTQILQVFTPISLFYLALLYVLVLATCVRFSQLNLAFWMLLMNFGILLRGFAWDKYALPTLAVLWYLKSIHALDNMPEGCVARNGNRHDELSEGMKL